LQSWIKADKSTGKNENNPEKTVDKVFGKKGRFSGSLMSCIKIMRVCCR